jgi:hypothetical protein
MDETPQVPESPEQLEERARDLRAQAERQHTAADEVAARAELLRRRAEIAGDLETAQGEAEAAERELAAAVERKGRIDAECAELQRKALEFAETGGDGEVVTIDDRITARAKSIAAEQLAWEAAERIAAAAGEVDAKQRELAGARGEVGRFAEDLVQVDRWLEAPLDAPVVANRNRMDRICWRVLLSAKVDGDAAGFSAEVVAQARKSADWWMRVTGVLAEMAAEIHEAAVKDVIANTPAVVMEDGRTVSFGPGHAPGRMTGLQAQQIAAAPGNPLKLR